MKQSTTAMAGRRGSIFNCSNNGEKNITIKSVEWWCRDVSMSQCQIKKKKYEAIFHSHSEHFLNEMFFCFFCNRTQDCASAAASILSTIKSAGLCIFALKGKKDLCVRFENVDDITRNITAQFIKKEFKRYFNLWKTCWNKLVKC